MKFTWDVARAFPDSKSRLDADAIAEALADLENNLGLDEKHTWQKRCILHIPKVVSGVKEVEVRKVKDLHPAFTAESYQGLAKIMKADEFQLSCVKKGKDGGAEESVDGSKTSSLGDSALPLGNACEWRVGKQR